MNIVKTSDVQLINNSVDLINKIAQKQDEMQIIAQEYGLSHELTLEKSQELDSLLNEYNVYFLDLIKVYTIEEITQIIKPIANKYHITDIYLYGSYARGCAKYDDDIDFAVKHEGETLINEFFDCLIDLENAFGKYVDLMFIETVYKPKTRFDYEKNFFAKKFDREKIRIL